MKIDKSYDKKLRELIYNYIDTSGTSYNYINYRKITNITDNIITGVIYNQPNELQINEIEECKQEIDIHIYKKIIKGHQFKKIDNLISYIFIFSKNRLIDHLRGHNTQKKLKIILENIQNNYEKKFQKKLNDE